jgi:hypothetical protein|tara:strand:+ start:19172 stop:19435 length:264 start_codon:yes stop_codon:yes gene_type:complete
MIVQLPNGRIIECSVELYLDLTDEEINELNGLGPHYTKECVNPFYNHFSSDLSKARQVFEGDEEYEPSLDEIDELEKRNDADFFTDD